MAYFDDKDKEHLIPDLVDNPAIAFTNSIKLQSPRELLHASRTWVLAKGVDTVDDALLSCRRAAGAI